MCIVCEKIDKIIVNSDNYQSVSTFIPSYICSLYVKDACEKLDNVLINYFFKNQEVEGLPITVYPGIKDIKVRTSAVKVSRIYFDYTDGNKVELIIPANEIFETTNDICLTVDIEYTYSFRHVFMYYYLDIAMKETKKGIKKTVKFLCLALEKGLNEISDSDWSALRRYILRNLYIPE